MSFTVYSFFSFLFRVAEVLNDYSVQFIPGRCLVDRHGTGAAPPNLGAALHLGDVPVRDMAQGRRCQQTLT